MVHEERYIRTNLISRPFTDIILLFQLLVILSVPLQLYPPDILLMFHFISRKDPRNGEKYDFLYRKSLNS